MTAPGRSAHEVEEPVVEVQDRCITVGPGEVASYSQIISPHGYNAMDAVRRRGAASPGPRRGRLEKTWRVPRPRGHYYETATLEERGVWRAGNRARPWPGTSAP